MSSELRPRILDDLGLLPALVWQAKRISEQTPVQIDFKYFNLAQRFPPEIATAAYRITQEALTNAVRHAKVNRVDLRAWADHGELTLLIEDHGVGFNPMDLPTGFSCGLSGIEERASLLGGEMILETSPGGGTRISITLPLNQQYTKVEM